MPVPAYTDVGKAAKDILLGSKEGVFNFNHKLSATTRTADGVTLNFTALHTGDKADLALKATYAYKQYSLASTLTTSDKVDVSAAVSDIAPGLKATLSATLPDASSGKLAVDYVHPYLNTRATVGLTSAPKVSVAAASAYKSFVYGGDATFDTAKSVVSAYSLGLAYHAPDSQVALQLADKCETLKVLVAHNVSRDKSFAAEVSRPVAGGDVSFTLGALRRLDNGALVKAKIDNRGILAALYEQQLSTGERLSFSSQLDTLNLSKAPKVGIAFDLA